MSEELRGPEEVNESPATHRMMVCVVLVAACQGSTWQAQLIGKRADLPFHSALLEEHHTKWEKEVLS